MGYRFDSELTKIMHDLNLDEYEASKLLNIPISDKYNRVGKDEYKSTSYFKLFTSF